MGKTLSVKPPASGYKRQWVRCKECRKVAYYDYIPYSLSNPVMCLPCGHGAAVRFSEAVTYIDPPKMVKVEYEVGND